MSHLLSFLDPLTIIRTLGSIGVFLIIFAESGLFVGFFLPGDSLLFTAGFLASQGYLSIWFLLVGCLIAAILGDNVGYLFGKKIGPSLFAREDSRFFKKRHLTKAHDFYTKHGKKTIILARFMPVVRTFAPIVAGIATMEYRIFLPYNIVGGTLWTASLLLLGYILGNTIPDIDKYLLPIVIGIIVISLLPGIFHFVASKKRT